MSVKLTEVEMGDGTSIFVEIEEVKNDTLRAAGLSGKVDSKKRLEMMKDVMGSTLKVFRESVLDQILNEVIDGVKPESISLDIGLQFGGEIGVPYVTKGSAEANLKVTIKWGMSKE